MVDAATFAVSALAVSLMSPQPPAREETAGVRRDLIEGFAYVRAHAWLWATLAGAALFLLVTYGPMEVLLPYIIKNELGGDASTFGTVLAVGGLGSIAAAVLLSITGLPRRHVTFMWSCWAVGVGMDIGLALAGAAWQMCLLAFFSFGLATAGLLIWSMLMYTLVPVRCSAGCRASTGSSRSGSRRCRSRSRARSRTPSALGRRWPGRGSWGCSRSGSCSFLASATPSGPGCPTARRG